MTPVDIIAEYERREKAAGGLAFCNPRKICEEIAEQAGIPYSEVRDALSAHWSGGWG